MLPQPAPPRSTLLGFGDVRSIALITCIASTLGIVGSLLIRLPRLGEIGGKFGSGLVLLVALLFGAILPTFYFALYHNRGTLRIPERLRRLALSAALVLPIALAADWLRRLGSTAVSVLAPREPFWSASHVVTAIDLLSSAADILLLIAFFRLSNDESRPNAPLSKLLVYVTKVTVIGWSIWLGIYFIRVVMAPYAYSVLRNRMLATGRAAPPFGGWIAQVSLELLIQACLFVAPYIVYKSLPRKAADPPAIPAEASSLLS